MLREVCKGLIVLLSSAIAVPYAVAAICHVLYSGPHSKKKLKRAFHPRKVFYLNYSVLQNLLSIRYIPILIRWKWFYNYADSYRLLKDIPFGRNDRCLDLYFPLNSNSRSLKPVVVFIYGGAWAKGDKSMYGLLCSKMADCLQAIVCCPNYSLYPQGYVDDMIQDVVDCVAWIYENIHEHGGNKDKVVLMGHSAGAHLAVMAVLELLHDEWVHGIRIEPPPSDSMELDEQYFDGSNSGNDVEKPASSEGSSASFDVLNGNSNDDQKGNGASQESNSSSFVLLSREESGVSGHQEEGVGREQAELERINSQTSDNSIEVLDMENLTDSEESQTSREEERMESDPSAEEEDEDEDDVSNKDEEDSVITVRPRIIDRQPTLMDLGKCVRGVIGFAGVYDIGEHYEYERDWGVEDISPMSRAMYGEEHFDRFSPALIVKNLTRSVKLPPMVFAHGSKDIKVPVRSSSSFAEALSDIFADVTLRIIPECNHTDICLDMMDIGRKYHDTIMNIIMETGQKIL